MKQWHGSVGGFTLLAIVAFAPACSKSSAAGTSAPEGTSDPGAAVEPWCGKSPCPCKPGTETQVQGHTGVCTLASPTTIQGLPAAAAQVAFTNDGVLHQLTLSEPHQIGDVKCKAGGTIEVWGPNRVKSCYAAEPVAIGDLTCTGSISRQKDGKLRRCELAKAAKVGELEMPAHGWITLDESGKPERFELGGTIQVQGHTCTGYMNYLYPDGKLKRCQLAGDEKIDGKPMKKGADVCWSEAGKVVDCGSLKFQML